jgi:hypothetical protein
MTTPMIFSIENIVQFLSILLPMYITFFMGMTGVFNNDFQKFGVWLGGVTITSFILILGQQYIGSPGNENCNAFNIPLRNTPSATSAFIMFTMMYLVCPMSQYKSWNYSVIAVFLILFVFDFVTKLKNGCTTAAQIVGGAIFGGIAAVGWYTMIKSAGGDKLLYFNLGSSNNVYCSKPKQQTFKCSVYKNGQMISSN